MTRHDRIEWCVKQHSNTNHMYDTYLPYRFHLNMVVDVYNDYKLLLPQNMFTDSIEEYRNIWKDIDITREVIELACWGHDLIEDTRTSYNECVQHLPVGNYRNTAAADIIYAVTNEKGKNRAERANDKYYYGIRKQKGATFVKLCDRIANVRYGKLTKSAMLSKYKGELDNFCDKLYTSDLDVMFTDLKQLLE